MKPRIQRVAGMNVSPARARLQIGVTSSSAGLRMVWNDARDRALECRDANRAIDTMADLRRGEPETLCTYSCATSFESALLYASKAMRQTGDQDIWVVTSLIVCASFAVDGMTAGPLTPVYGNRTRQ